MFYSQFVLSKKGPLSKIWLAAHWERKLSKAQIFETNVQDAVDEILQPKVKLSLRTTGHLLLGIVRIYSRKVKYVLEDCNEAFLKIKMAFRPGRTENELRDKETRDASADIQPIIHDFYDNLPDINDFDVGNIANFHNQTKIDEITIQDERFETSSYQNLELGFDDFGEREQQLQKGVLDSFEEGREGGSFANLDLLDGSLNQPRTSLIQDNDDFNWNNNKNNLAISAVDDFNKEIGTADELDMIFDGGDDLYNPQAPGSTPAYGLNQNPEERMEVDFPALENHVIVDSRF